MAAGAEDAGLNTARRCVRPCVELARPFVWTFAALAALLIAFPTWGVESVKGDAWGSAGVRTMIATGGELLPIAGTAFGPGWSPHPRVLSVTVSGRAAGPDEDPDDPEFHGFSWPIAGLQSYDTLSWVPAHPDARPTDFLSAPNLPGAWRSLRGAVVSLWIPALLAGGIAILRRRRRSGREGRDGSSDGSSDGPPEPPRLRRRLLRPWVGTAAAVGLIVTSLHWTTLGPGRWTALVVGGPADTPHPRALELTVDCEGFGPPLIGEVRPQRWAAPRAGAWAVRYGDSPKRWPPGFPLNRASVALSLWWFALPALAANGVTLRRARRGSSGPSAGEESPAPAPTGG